MRPWIILLEAVHPRDRQLTHHKWEHHILSQGYHYVYFDGINRYYVSDEHGELDAAFETRPICGTSLKNINNIIYGCTLRYLKPRSHLQTADVPGAWPSPQVGREGLVPWVLGYGRARIASAELGTKRVAKFVLRRAVQHLLRLAAGEG